MIRTVESFPHMLQRIAKMPQPNFKSAAAALEDSIKWSILCKVYSCQDHKLEGENSVFQDRNVKCVLINWSRKVQAILLIGKVLHSYGNFCLTVSENCFLGLILLTKVTCALTVSIILVRLTTMQWILLTVKDTTRIFFGQNCVL